MDLNIIALNGYQGESSTGVFAMQPDLVQYLQLLLRGMSIHAMQGDADDLRGLQRKVSAIADSISEKSTPDDLLVGIGTALRSVEEYNQRASDTLKSHATELRTMLSTMTDTIKFLSSSSASSVSQLETIETKLQRACTLEDTRLLRTQMVDCLTLVRDECSRVKMESKAKVESLRAEVERLASRLLAGATESYTDSTTGLPARVAAEEKIAKNISSGREFIAALFVIDRLASINGRFGRSTGDEILLMGAHHLAQRLSGATLYRWTGPAFMAIIDIKASAALAETQAKQAGSMRLEKTMDAGNRSVLLLITCSFQLQRVSGNDSAEKVCRAADKFMAANIGDAVEAE